MYALSLYRRQLASVPLKHGKVTQSPRPTGHHLLALFCSEREPRVFGPSKRESLHTHHGPLGRSWLLLPVIAIIPIHSYNRNERVQTLSHPTESLLTRESLVGCPDAAAE